MVGRRVSGTSVETQEKRIWSIPGLDSACWIKNWLAGYLKEAQNIEVVAKLGTCLHYECVLAVGADLSSGQGLQRWGRRHDCRTRFNETED